MKPTTTLSYYVKVPFQYSKLLSEVVYSMEDNLSKNIIIDYIYKKMILCFAAFRLVGLKKDIHC